MRRREMLAGLLALGAGAPFELRGQPTGRRFRIGVLLPVAESGGTYLPAIREYLALQGIIEGRNLVLDVRYAKIDPDAAQDLVALKPDAILAATTAAAQAAQAATKSVPIVFAWIADPVLSGIVKDYARPGGNITGVTNRYYELAVKRLELLRDLLPEAKRVAVAGNFHDPVVKAALRFASEAAPRLGFELIVRSEIAGDWAIAVQGAIKSGAKALSVFNLFSTDYNRFEAANAVRAIADQRIPAVFADIETVEMGGLMSYATNLNEDLKRAIDLIALVLKGRRPGDIPVEQASRFEMALNLKTAKALGLTIPQSILVRADRVIE